LFSSTTTRICGRTGIQAVIRDYKPKLEQSIEGVRAKNDILRKRVSHAIVNVMFGYVWCVY
jgi:hypothetical protein